MNNVQSNWQQVGSTYGRTLVIDSNIYSLSIRAISEGAEYLFQKGKFDGQGGRFASHLKYGKADTTSDAYDLLSLAALSYAGSIHEIDLAGWQLGFDHTVESYGKVIELGDRDHIVEIRQLGETSADWLIQQGDEYDGVRDRYDHHITQGEVTCLANAFRAAMSAVEEYTPPARHVL